VLAPAEQWKELEDTVAASGKTIQAQMEERQEYERLTDALITGCTGSVSV
jgi:hypothetical protein